MNSQGIEVAVVSESVGDRRANSEGRKEGVYENTMRVDHTGKTLGSLPQNVV
jgi:hypothetical protein